MAASSATELWDELASAAAEESPLWSTALLARDEWRADPVFSALSQPRFALGVETIYEGYLAHYAAPRLFSADDRDTALLLGDYLYAHGLARIATLGSAAPVLDLAHLISLCAQLRGDGQPGDGVAWAATAALLGRGMLDGARGALREEGDAEPLAALARRAAGAAEVERALAAHETLLG